jgi:hypothetical protein
MERHAAASPTRMIDADRATLRSLPVPVALFGIAAAFGAFICVVIAAPTVVAFALAVALAVAWCVWLEGHPSAPEHGHAQSGPDAVGPAVPR